MNIEPVANPQARGNIRHGHMVFKSGVREPLEVLKAHLWWNRGAAADYHFANGYREAAENANIDIGEALRFFSPLLSDADRAIRRELIVSRLELPCPYDHSRIKAA